MKLLNAARGVPHEEGAKRKVALVEKYNELKAKKESSRCSRRRGGGRWRLATARSYLEPAEGRSVKTLAPDSVNWRL